MNNVAQDSKKEAALTVQDIEEDVARELGLTRQQLQFKVGHQLNELSERIMQRSYDNHQAKLTTLVVQREVDYDFTRVRKLNAQRNKTCNL